MSTVKTPDSLRGNARSPRPKQITQEELQKLVNFDEAARGRDLLRNDLLKRIQAGASVESGELSASLELRTVDRPTWDDIAKHMTPSAYLELRARYKGLINRYLRIRNSAGEFLR